MTGLQRTRISLVYPGASAGHRLRGVRRNYPNPIPGKDLRPIRVRLIPS